MTLGSIRYGVRPRTSPKRAAALILIGSTACLLALAPRPAHAQQPWLQHEDPADAGFHAGKLAEAKTLADSAGSAAVMAVLGGHVVVAWGDVARLFMAHSVRKSLYSALYGIAVELGEVDLDATLADLGVDDVPALTETERGATVRDLIAARSGVYHGAAYASSDQAEERPERGAYAPGEHFFYNNWDFNAASVIYEQATGEDVYESFDRRIARPLGMEDYDPAAGMVVHEPTVSRMPAHTFRISTRDLARFGQLYLEGGTWRGREVLPGGWVEESTSPVTDFGDGRGYGYMWWTYGAGSLGEDYPTLDRYDSYLARGTGGQALLVVPGADLVIVHRGDTDNGREVGGRAVWQIFERIAGAQVGDPVASPDLVPVRAEPLAGALEPPPALETVDLPADDRAAYLGEYRLQPGNREARVYVFEDRPFVWVDGLGDGELHYIGDDTFAVPVVPGTFVRFMRSPDGKVATIAVDYRGMVMSGALAP